MNFAVVWGGAIAAGFLLSLFSRAPIQPFLALAFTRPLLFVTAFLSIALTVSAVTKTSPVQRWNELVAKLPLALSIGLVAALSGIANDSSGAIALPIGQAISFLVSLGFVPQKFGPEALVRFSVLALVLLFVMAEWKKNGRIGKAALLGVTSWFSAGLVLLIQTWLAQLAAVQYSYPIFQTEDAMRALALLHTNSYWSNFQADRFFVGITKQLESSVALSSSGLLFLCLVVLSGLLILKLKPSLNIKKLEFALLAATLSLGALVGLKGQRFQWTFLDFLPLLILLTIFLLWYGFLVSQDRELFQSLILIGSIILGWPVLAGFLTLMVLANWTPQEKFYDYSRQVLMAGTLVFIGGVFGSRQSVPPAAIYSVALAWLAISLLFNLWPRILETKRIPYFPYISVSLAGIFLGLVFQTLAIIALTALLVLFLLWLKQDEKKWRIFTEPSILTYGIITTLMFIYGA